MSVVPVALGHHHAVSAGHDLAALAAFEVLEGGGNAIDAGVAAILTLGVVYSDQVSIAGVAPMIVYLADSGETWTIAGVGGWPRALDVDAFILAAEDLESFRCQVLPSVSRRFRLNGEEVEVHTCGAWCQGPILLEALATVEGLDMQALNHNSDAYLHTVAETIKNAGHRRRLRETRLQGAHSPGVCPQAKITGGRADSMPAYGPSRPTRMRSSASPMSGPPISTW